MGILAKPIPFGDYFLLEKINTGGMAEVFKAKSFGVEGFERVLAVKRILPAIAEDQEFISMFIDEAKIAVQLTHANIAQIFDLGCIDNQYYIAMEYVPGRDLRVIFDRAVKTGEKLGIDCVCYIISRLCEGLDYAHNKRDANGKSLGIVHRDISPQNVLISYDGECKLIDFGIAKAANKSSATQVGILKGKFSYMSPEQVSGKAKIDHRSDIFALGIVLFEMLTLRRLFLGSSDFSTLEKIRKVEVSPPTLYNPNIPEELEDIVLRALEKDIALRFQSAHEMQEAIQKFMFNQKMYYTAKDLSDFSHKMFAQEIALEQKKAEFYKELTRDVLNKSKVEEALEDPTSASFYDKASLKPSPDFSMEHLPAQAAPKQAIYAELDEFEPPKDDEIVYSQKDALDPVDSAAPLGFSPELPPPKRSLADMQPVSSPFTVDTRLEQIQSKEQNNTRFFVWIVALLLLVIGIISGVYLYNNLASKRPSGQLSLQVLPVGTRYSIDINDKPYVGTVNGKDYLGSLEESLVLIDSLPANQELHYRIRAEGYNDVTGSLVLGEDSIESLSVAMQALKLTDLEIFVEPKSALVYVDDVPLPGVGHFQTKTLSPGPHVVRVSKVDYKDDVRTIVLQEKQALRLHITLNPAFASLRLESKPKDAKYEIKSRNSGQIIADGKTNSVVTRLSVDDTYDIKLTLNDKVIERTWTPRKDGRQDLISLEFDSVPSVEVAEEQPVVRPTTRSERPTRPARERPSTLVNRTEPEKASPAPKVAAAAPDANTPAILRINSKPPATILIDGKSYGTTPKKVELPAGSYKVRFVNDDAGINVEKSVTLGAGELKTLMNN
ncbi:MAG: serine/threonine-protein kinase [Bradymonadales bacterium]|jgi:serine/threonine protein kinase